MTNDELRVMFEKVWDERNATLAMTGQVAYKTPASMSDLMFVLDQSPLTGMFVPRKDYEAVVRAATPKEPQ